MRSLPFLLAISLLVLPAAHAQSWRASDEGYRMEYTKSYDARPGERLVVEDVIGSVRVGVGDGNRVVIQERVYARAESEAEARRMYERARPVASRDGNEVRLEGSHGSRDLRQSFYITVPRRFDVEIESVGGAVEVEGVEGDVELEVAGGSVSVTGVTGTLDIETAGGGITLARIVGPVTAESAGGGVSVRDVRGDVEIEVAGGALDIADVSGNVMAETAGGSIRVRNVGGGARLETAGGAIEAVGVRGSVEAETAGGRIVLDRLGGAVRAATSGGDVRGRDLDGDVWVETSAGDIELERVGGSIEAETSVGDIDVVLAPRAAGAWGRIELSASHGDVRLVLPADADVTIEAEVDAGGGWGDRVDIESDFPLTRAEERGGVVRSSGRLGGGRGHVVLRAEWGDVIIHKAGR